MNIFWFVKLQHVSKFIRNHITIWCNLMQSELIIILQKVLTYLVIIKVLVDLSSEAYFWFSQ